MHIVLVECYHNSNARFKFVGISSVYISGLKFVGCTGNRFESVDQFTLEDSSFVGQEDITGTALELVETSANLVQSSFNDNKGEKVHHVKCFRFLFFEVKVQVNIDTTSGSLKTLMLLLTLNSSRILHIH